MPVGTHRHQRLLPGVLGVWAPARLFTNPIPPNLPCQHHETHPHHRLAHRRRTHPAAGGGRFSDLGQGSMAERLARLSREYDDWRAATVLEPRGSDVVVGALCQPSPPTPAPVIDLFNNTGYLGMCGHGTIGLVATLAHIMGASARCPQDRNPRGHGTGHAARRRRGERAQCAGLAPCHPGGRERARPRHRARRRGPGAATGSSWSATTASAWRYNIATLTRFSSALREALEQAGITGADGAEIDHELELFAAGTTNAGERSRNFVLCPGMAYDRSPCGTGTSAKLACLAADGKLAPGAVWRQASVIGSQFEASYETAGERIIPTLRGRAWVCAEATCCSTTPTPTAGESALEPGRRHHRRGRRHRRCRLCPRARRHRPAGAGAGRPARGATAAGMGHLVVMDDNAAELALSSLSPLRLWHQWSQQLDTIAPGTHAARCGWPRTPKRCKPPKKNRPPAGPERGLHAGECSAPAKPWSPPCAAGCTAPCTWSTTPWSTPQCGAMAAHRPLRPRPASNCAMPRWWRLKNPMCAWPTAACCAPRPWCWLTACTPPSCA